MPGTTDPQHEPATPRRHVLYVELAVAALLVAVLAAIAVPTFLHRRAEAQDVDAQTAARIAASHAEAWFASRRTYAGAGPAIARETPGVRFAYLRSAPAGGYLVTARSVADEGATFSIERRTDGSRSYYCREAGSGRCPDDHDWNDADGVQRGSPAGAAAPVAARYVPESR